MSERDAERPDWARRLIFSLEVSLRYHKAREAHLSGYIRFVSWANVVGGSAVVGNLIGQGGLAESFILLIGVALTAINGHVVTSGVGERQRLHSDLARRFATLQFKIEKACEDETGLLSEAVYRQERREIEHDEPAIYCALQDVKYNEVCVALGLGREHLIKVSPINRAFRNYIRFERECAVKVPESETEKSKNSANVEAKSE